MAEQTPVLRPARRAPAPGWVQLIRLARARPLGTFGGLVVAGLLAVGLLADLLAPYSYDDFDPARRLRPPTAAHPFGTDEQGRDVLSRVVYGARVSMVVAVGSALVATLVGSVIGTLSGYFGGTADLMTQRLIDVWLAFPGLIFVIFLVGILSNSFPVLILTIGLLYSAGSSRVVRGAVMVIRDSLYVEAARAVGARHGRILLRHILPNVLAVIIVNASAQLGSIILLESSLSFLGFGPPPPFPSWGRMLSEARTQMVYHPNLMLFPGLAVTLAVFSFNMFGDAVRDLLDPRLRGR
jgi:peptide/nickel transport system permease protein